MKECMIKSPCVLFFPTITGEQCCLHFGYGAKFKYEFIANGMVRLIRSNMDFEIKKSEFEKMCKPI